MFLKSTRSSLSALTGLGALALTVVWTSGCGNMTATAVDGPVAATGSISGILHGGRQPVSGATVTLWAAGNSGYGSASRSLATATSTASGGFSFGPTTANGVTTQAYTCPTSNDTVSQQIYLTATGGQPSTSTTAGVTTSVTNNQAAFMLALGDCVSTQSANPSVIMNEVTTVASIFALQQFFTPSTSGLGSIGTSSTNITGLRNAFSTVKNLVDTPSGTSVVKTVSGVVSGYSTNPTVTITPEITKINTIANILAACVNTGGTVAGTTTDCGTLFADVNATAAKDTVQAAYYMAVNPTSTVGTTSNITAIYNTATPSSPFNPSLSAAPTDWSVGVTYGSNSFQTVNNNVTPVTTSSTYLLTEPEWVAIDSQGNVYLANFSTTSATNAGNSVTELSPVGVPQAQVLTTAGLIAAPRNLIIDPSNNVYIGSYGASGAGKQITEFTTLNTTKTFPLLTAGPDGIASDGAGNIYVATYGGAAGSGDLEVIPAGSASGTTATLEASSVSVGTYTSMAIDANFTIWLSNNPNTATVQYICSAIPCTGTSTTAAVAPQSIAIDHGGNVWIGNYSSTAGSVAEIAATSTSTITAAAGSPFSGGGLASPFRGLIDGKGNVWETNYKSGAGTVSELSSAGAAISPSVGFAHTYTGAYGLALDASGNVWIGNSAAAASSTANGFVTEIVGQASPVVTPLAAGLPTTAGGANTIGTLP